MFHFILHSKKFCPLLTHRLQSFLNFVSRAFWKSLESAFRALQVSYVSDWHVPLWYSIIYSRSLGSYPADNRQIKVDVTNFEYIRGLKSVHSLTGVTRVFFAQQMHIKSSMCFAMLSDRLSIHYRVVSRWFTLRVFMFH